MKEYIYLDEDMLNSTLAQLDGGLLKSISQSDENTHNTVATTAETDVKGLDIFLHLGAKYVKEVTEESGQELTKSQIRALDYALNDYAVDVLLEKIKDFESYTNLIEESKEGQLINFQSKFSIYDFSLLKEITDKSMVDIFFGDHSVNKDVKELKHKIALLQKQANKNPQLKKELKDLKSQLKQEEDKMKSATEGFEVVTKAATVAERVLGGSLFVKTENSLSLCKRECFRLNKGQLALLTETDRKIKVLGLVTAIKDNIHNSGFENFQPNELNKVPSIFTDIFLSSFNMIQLGDRIITPIAIFFE